MSELNRLLGFMSSWDRKAALKEYTAMFASCEDADALMEELGTPTRLAFRLAGTYVPTPPPELPDVAEAAGEADVQQIEWDLSGEAEPEELPQPVEKRVKKGALAAYLIPAIIIGLPVAVLLICLGLPFLAVGAGLVVTVVLSALAVVSVLTLVSDILLAVGAALVLCALGLLLFWLGLWISMELCWLWTDKVLVALGRKLCVKEVPAK